jgi:hypothetical protein
MRTYTELLMSPPRFGRIRSTSWPRSTPVCSRRSTAPPSSTLNFLIGFWRSSRRPTSETTPCDFIMVTDAANHFVYLLLDEGKPFYVGRSNSDYRLHGHVYEALHDKEGKAKNEIIRRILADGGRLCWRKVAEGLTKAEACKLEQETMLRLGHATLTKNRSQLAHFLHRCRRPYPVHGCCAALQGGKDVRAHARTSAIAWHLCVAGVPCPTIGQ